MLQSTLFQFTFFISQKDTQLCYHFSTSDPWNDIHLNNLYFLYNKYFFNLIYNNSLQRKMSASNT